MKDLIDDIYTVPSRILSVIVMMSQYIYTNPSGVGRGGKGAWMRVQQAVRGFKFAGSRTVDFFWIRPGQNIIIVFTLRPVF